jgi:hypothetical protein
MSVLLSLLGVMGCSEFAWAGSLTKTPDTNRVTLIVLNRLCLEDLMVMPGSALEHLVLQGAIGLMNTRTGGGLTPENAYTTLGGGFRLVGAAGAKLALPILDEHHGEKAKDIYQRRTGEDVAPGSIVVLDIESIKANNLASFGIERVGVIGEALRGAKRGAALIGNADTDEYQRWAALIAMDGKGQVLMGSIGPETNLLDTAFPSGRRTDYDALWQAYLAVRPKAAFIVVDLGDVDRVEGEKKQLTASLYRSYRQVALRNADTFLQTLLETVDLEEEWILIISPLPPGEAIADGKLLTPIIVAGPGILPGLVVSRTTRRPGVVTNYDIAPTVLSWLELSRPKGLPGAVLASTERLPRVGVLRSVSVTSAENTSVLAERSITKMASGESGQLKKRYSYLQDLLTRSAATYRQRPPLLKTFVSLEIIIYLAIFGLLAVFPSLPRGWVGFASFLLLLVASMPLALLILPILRPTGVMDAFLHTLVMALVLTGMTWHLVSRTEDRFAVICGLTAVSLVVDTLLGGFLVKFSPLGYDVMLGARFYGIGNEYMGILVGSSLLATLVVRARWPRGAGLVLLWFLVVLILLALPSLGANAGGTITALIAFPLAYGLQSRGGARVAIAALAFVVLVIILLNLFPSAGTSSHVTRALRLVAVGDWSEISAIAQRKLAMNWKLMRYSIWSKGLLVALGIMAILVYRPTPVVHRAMEEHPPVQGIVFSTIIASLAALVFNDSGVVAGGTTSVYAAGLVLSLILEQRARNPVDLGSP